MIARILVWFVVVFQWGSSFSKSMLKPKFMNKVTTARVCPLDLWMLKVIPLAPLSDESSMPLSLARQDGHDWDKVDRVMELFGGEAAKPAEDAPWFKGKVCNYFSLGMDARVAFGFDSSRKTNPARFNSVFYNKYVYFRKGVSEGGFMRCSKPPILNNRLQVWIRMDGGYEKLELPPKTRGIIVLNLRSYGGGTDLASTGAHDDGWLEVLCFSSFGRLAVAAGPGALLKCMRLKVRGRSDHLHFMFTEPLFLQVDGEPWLQSPGYAEVEFYGKS